MGESQKGIAGKEFDTKVFPFIRNFTIMVEIRSALAWGWGRGKLAAERNKGTF